MSNEEYRLGLDAAAHLAEDYAYQAASGSSDDDRAQGYHSLARAIRNLKKETPMEMKRRVIIESPYNAETAEGIAENVAYAKLAIMDSLRRGEAPIASHLLFTQEGILKDSVPSERRLGMAAGHAWIRVADAVVFYTDRGMSNGMDKARQIAFNAGVLFEVRKIL